ncbi:hypothetical protein GWO43_26255 [candidate division KSB1 bacterium]|nr:hypothetical protein [candidate division KSB1 bacterium]NIR69615.1 hypothetical protein [candidate division KSB1 bacterium]NIS27460.1 hypothetical protein [candidate division KSB1 bacterium]NIT74312.1 hypothetical protein [candidate division KSB1 bacterium]NIU28174.1 hypothetical protein [candidate division KSB1 bacterium]
MINLTIALRLLIRRVPSFHPFTEIRFSDLLAWDGDSFWVFNDEIDSIVKLKLEGL